MKPVFNILPRGFASLLDYIAPSAFKVVKWQQVLKQAPKISKEILTKKSVPKLKENFAPQLPEGLTFAEQDCEDVYEDDIATKNSGEILLALYFKQLYCGTTIFIDLRPERFTYRKNGMLAWDPNGLWVDFEESFIVGMRMLYDGFYTNNNSLLNSSLAELGLISESMNGKDKDELIHLLEKHFGSGRDEPMSFSIESFMISFDQMFLFLKKHGVKLSGDFLYLGIYLVTLYLHLEKIGKKYDTKSAFLVGSRLS